MPKLCLSLNRTNQHHQQAENVQKTDVYVYIEMTTTQWIVVLGKEMDHRLTTGLILITKAQVPVQQWIILEEMYHSIMATELITQTLTEIVIQLDHPA